MLVCALKRHAFRRYLLLNLYMGGLFVSELARYKVLTEYGFSSRQYQYFYYYSDAVLTIFLYFALSTLYAHVFSEMNAERYVRVGTLLLLGGTALFTYAVVQQSTAKLVTHFVVELSQNLYFVRPCSYLCFVGRHSKTPGDAHASHPTRTFSGRLFQFNRGQLRYSEFVSLTKFCVCPPRPGVWDVPPPGVGICFLALT